jgi:hypothetical protein
VVGGWLQIHQPQVLLPYFAARKKNPILLGWEPQKHPARPFSRSYCYPIFTELKAPCVVCNGPRVLPVIRPKTYCAGCNKYMCFKKGCYKEYHESL